jgi:hypothetical protein
MLTAAGGDAAIKSVTFFGYEEWAAGAICLIN